MLKEKQSKCSKMTWRPQDFKKLLHVILATQEAGIRRIVVPSQPANSLRDPISKTPITKKKWEEAGEGPEFKPQYRKKGAPF
jgi:hypothetical protein